MTQENGVGWRILCRTVLLMSVVSAAIENSLFRFYISVAILSSSGVMVL